MSVRHEAKSINLKEYFELTDTGFEAGLLLEVQPKGSSVCLEFIICDTELYDPDKFWKAKEPFLKFLTICQEEINID